MLQQRGQDGAEARFSVQAGLLPALEDLEAMMAAREKLESQEFLVASPQRCISGVQDSNRGHVAETAPLEHALLSLQRVHVSRNI